MADTGNGTTVTFGTSSFTAAIDSVEWGGMERPAINTSHLGTTSYETFMPGDMVDPGEVTLNIQYDPDAQPPIAGAAETITIRYPTPSGGSAGATHVGTGFVTKFTPGNAKNNELMMGSVTIKFSGSITFTDHT